jgi:hypothetical protein
MIYYFVFAVLSWGAAATPCVLPTNFYCNQTDPYCAGAEEIEVYEETFYDCD